jgi:hypothetical protein
VALPCVALDYIEGNIKSVYIDIQEGALIYVNGREVEYKKPIEAQPKQMSFFPPQIVLILLLLIIAIGVIIVYIKKRSDV